MQKLPPVSIFLMEVKAPAMKLALEGKGKFCSRTWEQKLTLKKLTLTSKAG